MPIALTPDETFEYQLLEDRKDGPDGTWFILGALTPRDEAEIGNRFISYRADGSVESVNHGTSGLERLIRALRGWRNFKDKDGKPVPFVKGEAALAYLTQRQRGELIRAHREHFSVSETEGN